MKRPNNQTVSFLRIPPIVSCKLLTAIAVCVLATGLCSCGHRPLPSCLHVADSLVACCPDSALTLLHSWKDSMASASEGERMYYNLLTVKALDKAYVKHTSDSLITDVIRYCENLDSDRQLLAEAYYYGGRVCRDLGDSPQALEYFFKASETVSEDNLDLAGRMFSQIGTLYLYQNVYDLALSAFRKSYGYNSRNKDYVSIVLMPTLHRTTSCSRLVRKKRRERG